LLCHFFFYLFFKIKKLLVIFVCFGGLGRGFCHVAQVMITSIRIFSQIWRYSKNEKNKIKILSTISSCREMIVGNCLEFCFFFGDFFFPLAKNEEFVLEYSFSRIIFFGKMAKKNVIL
jgi:hypothetical protein